MDYRKAKGVSRLRTMHSTKQRSIPRMQRSSAIELFLLEKEQERFMKEAERIEGRLLTVYERIEVLSEEIAAQRQADAAKYSTHDQKINKITVVKSMLQSSNAKVIVEGQENGQWNTKKLMY